MFQLSAKNTINKYTNKLNKISNRPAIAILQAYIFIYSFLNFCSPIKNLHCIYGALTMSISWDLHFMTYTKYTLLSQLALFWNFSSMISIDRKFFRFRYSLGKTVVLFFLIAHWTSVHNSPCRTFGNVHLSTSSFTVTIL